MTESFISKKNTTKRLHDNTVFQYIYSYKYINPQNQLRGRARTYYYNDKPLETWVTKFTKGINSNGEQL